jgi:hypothetical protein
VSNLHASLKTICGLLSIDSPPALAAGNQANDLVQNDETENDGTCELSPPGSPSAVQAPIDTYLKAETSPNDSHTRRTRRRPSERLDLVSKGVVSFEVATSLVNRYLTSLDRFLYGIASHFRGLTEVRQTSPVLLAAICSVSALHDAQNKDIFEACNREYRSLVSASLFEKRDIEYIRALCIGSFWLPDASRILLSEAIRRAADCRLHRDFYRLTEASEAMSGHGASFHEPNDFANGARTSRTLDQHAEASSSAGLPNIPARDLSKIRDRVRLWYLLFICDSHLSILHNRDPVLRPEKDAIDSREFFLSVAGSTGNDVRIISQVSLLVIMGQIKDVFGSERSRPVPRALAVQLSHFGGELDRWFARFSSIFGKSI